MADGLYEFRVIHDTFVSSIQNPLTNTLTMLTKAPLRQLSGSFSRARLYASSANRTTSSEDSEIPVASIQPRAGSPIDVLVVGAGNSKWMTDHV